MKLETDKKNEKITTNSEPSHEQIVVEEGNLNTK